MTKRDWLFLGCEAGHDWRHMGGRNASCGLRDCCCSVPVYECALCGDCDYGDNAEAAEMRATCATEIADMEADEERWRQSRMTPSPAMSHGAGGAS